MLSRFECIALNESASISYFSLAQVKSMKHGQTVKPMLHRLVDQHLPRPVANQLTVEPLGYRSFNLQIIHSDLFAVTQETMLQVRRCYVGCNRHLSEHSRCLRGRLHRFIKCGCFHACPGLGCFRVDEFRCNFTAGDNCGNPCSGVRACACKV